MQANKLDFSNDVLRIILGVSKVAFNLNSDKDVENVFGLNNDKMKAVIEEITRSLPDSVFNETASRLEEIKNIFAREFIFFQVQEKGNAPHYRQDLSHFIYIFSRDIQQKNSMNNADLLRKGE